MIAGRRIVLGIAMSLLPLTAVRAGDVTPNVNPGLWQTTASVQTAGRLPMPATDLALLPPERRAQFEAAMKSASQLHTFMSFLTAAQLRKELSFSFQNNNPSCKRTVVSRTASSWEMHEECTGPSQRRTSARCQAISAAEITGQTLITIIKGARTITSKGNVHSKWLGSDCGSVQPGADIQIPNGQ